MKGERRKAKRNKRRDEENHGKSRKEKCNDNTEQKGLKKHGRKRKETNK